jgi:hypothetical protein
VMTVLVKFTNMKFAKPVWVYHLVIANLVMLEKITEKVAIVSHICTCVF